MRAQRKQCDAVLFPIIGILSITDFGAPLLAQWMSENRSSVCARRWLKKLWLKIPYFHLPLLITAPTAGPGASVSLWLTLCGLSRAVMPAANVPQRRSKSSRSNSCSSDKPCIPSEALASKKILIRVRFCAAKALNGTTNTPSPHSRRPAPSTVKANRRFRLLSS